MSKTTFNKETYKNLQDAVNLISNAVKVTLGPRGKNVLTINSYGDAHLTKDGITVAKSVKSDDPIINGILNTVREASANTAKSVGDGSTSTLVLTQTIFNNGLELIQNGANPTLVKSGMNLALKEVTKYILKHSEQIDINSDRLEQVAYISANNDYEIGNIAVEAVRAANVDGIVKIEDSRSSETTIKCDSGLTFDRGYISPHFLNTSNTTIEYCNPLIFVSSIEVSNKTLIDLMKHAKDCDKPLVIIAPEFNENIFSSMFKNHKAGVVQICPIKLPGFAGNRTEWIEDITAYINGECYLSNNINPIKFLGTAERVLISADETSILNSTLTETCVSHVEKLRNRISDDISEIETDRLNKRLALILGRVVTIFVGAITELELKEKKDRIEDAVCALQTALRGGISEGGGMTFLKAFLKIDGIKDVPEDTTDGYFVVINALRSPFKQLAANSDVDALKLFDEFAKLNNKNIGYNFKSLKWENLKKTGVIDPTQVLLQSIINAVSIASNLLTTECIVYYE